MDFPEVIPPIISSFAACCTLLEAHFDTKKLVFLFSNWLVAFIGDGCSVNKLAGEKSVNFWCKLSSSFVVAEPREPCSELFAMQNSQYFLGLCP